jgi:hypothetical protein
VEEVGRLKEQLRAAEKDEQARAAKVAELESEVRGYVWVILEK